MIAGLVSRALDRGALAFLAALAAIGILVPVLNLFVPATSPFYLSSYFVALFGKYLCFAILALSIDLIWGYCGILSLGHGACTLKPRMSLKSVRPLLPPKPKLLRKKPSISANVIAWVMIDK